MAEQYLAQTQQQRQMMVLAPQLRQSLELLQVPILELRTLVQQEMQQNPTLEEKLPQNEQVEVEPGSSEPEDTKELDFKEEFKVLARLDDEWREYFQQSQATHHYTAEDAQKRQFFFDSIAQPKSLQEHLLSQVALAGLSETDRPVAELLIGSINDDGYLTTSIEEISQATGFDVARLRELLEVIQEFDPIGVGARDLKECLLLQLQRLGKEDSLVASIVRDHLDELGARKYANIAKALKISVEEVQQAAHFIGTLEPKPGRMFTAEAPAYVLPEVVVQKVGDEYLIILNRDQIPHLFISKHYRQLMDDANTARGSEDLCPRQDPRRRPADQEHPPATADHLPDRVRDRVRPARLSRSRHLAPQAADDGGDRFAPRHPRNHRQPRASPTSTCRPRAAHSR